jgi:spermidine synthase
MTSLYRYRFVFYILCFLSGLTSLLYQCIWQKYLAIMMGSHSTSILLVVTFFLFGLGLGSEYWGKKTQHLAHQSQALFYYGVLECLLGIYALLFHFIFLGLDSLYTPIRTGMNQFLSLPPGDPSLILSSFFTILVILPPTFCMGGTIPLMNYFLSKNETDASLVHKQLYRLNTLGAFVSLCLYALFFSISFGYQQNLLWAGLLNLLIGSCSFIFYRHYALSASGNAHPLPAKEKKSSTTSPQYSPQFLYFLVAFSGLISLSFEMHLMKIFASTIGLHVQAFPICLSVIILCLFLGTFYRSNKMTDLRYLFFSCLLGYLFIFLSIPYWPLWFHLFNAHWVMAKQPTLYFFYSVTFFTVILSPLLIPLGRIIPLTYEHLKKTDKNYSHICGRMYVFNNMGSLLGSFLFGHLLFRFFNIQGLMRLTLILILSISIYAFYSLWKTKRPSPLRSALMSLLIIFSLIVSVGHQWNQNGFTYGFYRYSKIDRWMKSYFQLPSLDYIKTLFLKDDPGATVRVIQSYRETSRSLSLIVNGKSDGRTLGPDLSTVTLLAIWPYLMMKPTPDRYSAIIGLGTGLTAFTLSQLSQMKHIDVLDISPAVIEASPIFFSYHKENWSLPLKKNNIHIHENDAFDFFKHTTQKYHSIHSEPTNPWIMGVENLYTPEFYKVCSDRLLSEGIFTQWIHLYSLNLPIFNSIIHNLKSIFPHITMLKVNKYDILLLGSKKAFDWSRVETFKNIPEVSYALKKIMIIQPFEMMVQVFSSLDDNLKEQSENIPPHSLFAPTLQKEAFKTFLSKNFLQMENDQQLMDKLSDYRKPSSNSDFDDLHFTKHLKQSYQEYKKWVQQNPNWNKICQNVNPEIQDPYSCQTALSILDYKGDFSL